MQQSQTYGCFYSLQFYFYMPRDGSSHFVGLTWDKDLGKMIIIHNSYC